MLYRLFVNLRKRKLYRGFSRIKRLIQDNNMALAEKRYRALLGEYKRFCQRATYLEKLSAYHNMLYLYNELTKRKLREEKPVVSGRSWQNGKKRRHDSAHHYAGHHKGSVPASARSSAPAHTPIPTLTHTSALSSAKIPPPPSAPSSVPSSAGAKNAAGKALAERSPAIEAGTGINISIAKGELGTQIDSLYAYIQEKGSVDMVHAAERLKVSHDKIEEWSKILDEHGMIKIYYPAFTSPQLRSLIWQQKADDEKKMKRWNKSGKHPAADEAQDASGNQ